jgi:hypothetical protein
MCGIVGAIPRGSFGFDKKSESAFYDMLFCDTLRGDDGTGVIMVENTTGFGIVKEGYAAPYCIDGIQATTLGKAMYPRGKAMIGHNRKGTIGVQSDETSHPFVVKGEFAMVHNGTLQNHKKLADTVVDSEALAIHLEPVLNGDWDLEKFEEAIGMVTGAYAIAAYSQHNNQVYLLRNDQRPLSFVDTPEGFFWASEMGMLYWILGRNGITLKGHEPVVVKENSLYKIDLDTNKVEVVSYVPKKAIPVTYTVTGHSKTIATTSVMGNGAGGTKRLSKNAFKRIKKQWFGTLTDFWADDFIEKEYPKTIAEGASDVLLIGQIDEITFDHAVHAEFDLNELHPKEQFLNCLYYGRITDMEYDNKTGMVTVTASDVKKTKSSKKVVHENIPALH